MVGALDGSSPGGGMLAVMFFALIVGAAITIVGENAGPFVKLLESVYEVVMAIIGMAMRLAPIGVAGLVFSLTALLGLDILKTLGWYVATVLGGLTIHMVVVYSLLIAIFAGLSPWRFFRGSAGSWSRPSPPAHRCDAPDRPATRAALGVRRDISSFVLTVGSTANQNGTALYEGITVLFLAQVFGVELTLQKQVTVVVMAVLAGIGTAGIPGGSLPMIVLVLQSVGVPGEGIGIILGVDRLLDMSRTVVNVSGDIAIAACVHKAEGGTWSVANRAETAA